MKWKRWRDWESAASGFRPTAAAWWGTAHLFRAVPDGRMAASEASDRLAADRPGVEFSNGFFHKKAGVTWTAASA